MLKNLPVFLFAIFLQGCTAATVNVPICGQPNLPPEDAANAVENFLGEAVMWDQHAFPIGVTVDPGMSEEKMVAVRQAIEVWNEETGLQVFVYNGRGPNPNRANTIWIVERELPKSRCGGQVYGYAHRYFRTDALGIKTAIDRGIIELHTGVPGDRILSTSIHELGHILGLHHDREIESIMYPYNLPDRGDISEEDLQFVRDMIQAPRTNGMTVDLPF